MKAKDLNQILQNMNQNADIVIPALNNKGIPTYREMLTCVSLNVRLMGIM